MELIYVGISWQQLFEYVHYLKGLLVDGVPLFYTSLAHHLRNILNFIPERISVKGPSIEPVTSGLNPYRRVDHVIQSLVIQSLVFQHKA